LVNLATVPKLPLLDPAKGIFTNNGWHLQGAKF
jgi:hypothetical protein